jgi:hypothetical protein
MTQIFKLVLTHSAANAYAAPPMRTPRRQCVRRGGQSPLTPGEKSNGRHTLIKVVFIYFFQENRFQFPPFAPLYTVKTLTANNGTAT